VEWRDRPEKSEVQLAYELIKVLDGLPISVADNALIRARNMLLQTQIVSASSPLLLATTETERALWGQKPIE
jgi:alpha-glucuronidase